MFKTLLAMMLVVVANAATPITANFSRNVSAYQADGSLKPTLQEHGTFARNSKGDEATVTDTQATIAKRDEGTRYMVRKAGQTYSTMPWTSQAQSTYARVASQALAHGVKGQTLNGVYCVMVPIYSTSADKGKIQSGSMCVSPDLGVIVRRELDGYLNGKKISHWVEEMTDLQLTEPDSTLFSIPQGYKQLDSPEQCTTCVKK